MRLIGLLLIATATAGAFHPQPPTTSVVWIQDCSQSHYSTLAPAPLDRFGVRSRPIDSLVQAVGDNLGPGAEARVLSFGTGLRLSPGWVRTRAELATAMGCGDALNGPSPIWDAVYRSVEVLEERSGPRAILMITDGRSSANTHGFDEALERSRRGAVRVSIALARTELMSTRKPLTLNADRRGDPAERLKKLAEATGGRYAELSVWDLPAFFTDVAKDWQK